MNLRKKETACDVYPPRVLLVPQAMRSGREGFDRYAGSSFALRLGAELFPLPERRRETLFGGSGRGSLFAFENLPYKLDLPITTTILLISLCQCKIVTINHIATSPLYAPVLRPPSHELS